MSQRRMSKSEQDHCYRTPAANECACDAWAGHRVLNVGRNHYAVCDVCRHYDFIGSNLFSCWRHETEADWRRNHAELSLMSECECVFEPQNYTDADLQDLREREYAEAAEPVDLPF